MRIHQYLCDDEFRENLIKYLSEKAPEILECDVNFNPSKGGYLMIYEKNRPDGTGKSSILFHSHTFVFAATSGGGSYQNYWTIFEDTELDSFVNKNIGYKTYIEAGHAIGLYKYPDLDKKVSSLIREFVRISKINQIL